VVAKKEVSACPCGSGRDYAVCCGRFISGSLLPSTAGELMRSRYTAYTRRDEHYLLSTWHPDTRPTSLDLHQSPQPAWIGLKVVRHEQPDDTHAIVEFVARYKINGRAHKLHETSRFLKLDGRWLYLDALDTETD
jgi:SEC-C motif domain protein